MRITMNDLMTEKNRQQAFARLDAGLEEFGQKGYGLFLVMELSMLMVLSNLPLETPVDQLGVFFLNQWHEEQEEQPTTC